MSSTIDPEVLQGLGLAQPVQQRKSDKLGQDDFLRLMITQLENQDPLKPMENGQFLGQIAQFGTVSGINDLQSAFQQLSSALYSNQALQASAMVGRSVLAPADRAVLALGGNVTGQIDIDQGAETLVLTIADAAGQVIRRLDLGAHSPGTVDFHWDGLSDSGVPASPGVYRVSAQASIDGQNVGAPIYVTAAVESVSLGRNGEEMRLNLAGLGSASLADIRQIR